VAKKGYFLPEKFKKDRLEFILLGTLQLMPIKWLFTLGLPRFVVGIFAL